MTTQDNLFLPFFLSIDENINRLEYYGNLLMCFHSIFNLLKRIGDGSFLFLCKTLVFIFLPFLEFGCPN